MKNLKGIISAVLVAVMALSLCACAGVKEISVKDFKSTIKDVMDCDKEDIYETDSAYYDYIDSYAYYSGEDSDKYEIRITEYEDEEAAQYNFDEIINQMDFIKKHDGIEGKYKTAKNYYVIDAEVEYDYDADTVKLYGGVYIAKNYIISVSTSTGKDKDKDVIDEFLSAIGYPKPSRAK